MTQIPWADVEAWANDKLDAARVSNDNPSLDAVETARLRGRIQALKELIALPKTLEVEASRSMEADPPLY